MGVASAALPVAAPASRGLTWGLWAFIWLLPFHIVAIATLFGVVGLPLLVVRGIAAWKEATVALLVALPPPHGTTCTGSPTTTGQAWGTTSCNARARPICPVRASRSPS